MVQLTASEVFWASSYPGLNFEKGLLSTLFSGKERLAIGGNNWSILQTGEKKAMALRLNCKKPHSCFKWVYSQ